LLYVLVRLLGDKVSANSFGVSQILTTNLTTTKTYEFNGTSVLGGYGIARN
jgi:hypothetical protein